MRMLCLTKYGSRAASTRQRLLQFQPALAEAGIEIEVRPLLDNDYLDRLAQGRAPNAGAVIMSYARRLFEIVARPRHDSLWVQYELFPYLPGAFERLARFSGRPYIVDYDDAIFHMYDNHRRSGVRLALGTKLAPLLKSASGCMCGNEYIEAYVRNYCPETILMPTVLDTECFVPGRRRSEDGRVTVGWIGSPSTWRYAEPLVKEILPALRPHGIEFLIVGAGRQSSDLDGATFREWDEATEVEMIQQMDIGIMPLSDEPWARGKCGYKLIQYLACGVPVVASPVGVNPSIVQPPANGLLATTSTEWAEAIVQLAASPERRRRMGESGRRTVVDCYSIQAHAERYVQFIKHTLA